MHSIKSQIKNWASTVFDNKREITTRTAILVIAVYSILLHCLLQIMLWLNDGQYKNGYTDIELYSLWARCFSSQLLSGELYPRWLQCVDDGMGEPTMFFYPPTAYYIGTLFYIPKILASFPYFQIHMLSLLGSILSAHFFYLWIKRYVSSYTALFTALVYISFHYQFNIVVVLRQAVAEQWSFVWMPLILIAVDNLFDKKKFCTPFLAASYFLLATTHLISALIFSIALGIYFIFRIQKVCWDRKIILHFALAILLGIGMAAIFILPITELISHVNMHLFTEGMRNYSKQFMFTSGRMTLTKDIPSDFWVIAAPLLAWIFYKDSIKQSSPKPQMMAMLCICIFSSFMMVTPSKPIWDILPILQKVQFPWRFFILQCLSLCFLAGIYFQKTGKRVEILLAIFFMASCIHTLMPDSSLEKRYMKDEIILTTELQQELTDLKNYLRKYNLDTSAELKPNTTCHQAKDPVQLTQCEMEKFPKIIKTPLIPANTTNARFSVIENLPRLVKLHYDTKTETNFTIKRAYFHGNVAHTDTGESIPISYNEYGMITLTAPKGEGNITISLPYFKSENIGGIVSLICMLIVTATLCCGFIRNERAAN